MSTKLEKLTAGAHVRGVSGSEPVVVEKAEWHGDVLKIIYRTPSGGLDEALLGRDQETALELASRQRAFCFDAEPGSFLLVLEASDVRRLQENPREPEVLGGTQPASRSERVRRSSRQSSLDSERHHALRPRRDR